MSNKKVKKVNVIKLLLEHEKKMNEIDILKIENRLFGRKVIKF